MVSCTFEPGVASALSLLALDAAVAAAGRGPLYFNLVVMVYGEWSTEMRAHLSSLGSPMPSTDEEDEDLANMLARAHTGTGGAGEHMTAGVYTMAKMQAWLPQRGRGSWRR
jgi:hypothetical protein